MNVEDIIPYLPAFFAGLCLGALNRAGLGYTVRRMAGSANPVPAFAVSMAVRYGAIAVVFYLLLRLGWEDLLAAFAGAVLAGFVLSRALGPVMAAGAEGPGGRRSGRSGNGTGKKGGAAGSGS